MFLLLEFLIVCVGIIDIVVVEDIIGFVFVFCEVVWYVMDELVLFDVFMLFIFCFNVVVVLICFFFMFLKFLEFLIFFFIIFFVLILF